MSGYSISFASFIEHSCADPESFVRGGPNLITFFCVFFS